MRIAITGASGFIGRHVLAILMQRPVEVVATTRNASRLAVTSGNVRVVEMDIGCATSEEYECLANSDALIHLAWDGLPNYGARHHFEIELPRQYRFLKELVGRGLPALVVSGTCFEYGLGSGPLSEGRAALPVNPYGFAKDCLRRELEFLALERPFAMTWARLFYTYGRDQAPTSLYPMLMAAVAKGSESFDMSGGEQLRDYLPVEEVARLIVELAMRRTNSGPVNVCSGQPISVRRLVEGWIADNEWNIRLNCGRLPYPEHEAMAFWGTRTKLDGILGADER